MISIYVTTDARSRLAGLLQPLNGWNNVVQIESGQELTHSHIAESPWHVVVAERGMWLPLSWDDTAPPYIFPQPLSLTPDCFVGFLNYLAGDYSKALQAVAKHPLVYAEMKEAVAIATGNVSALNTDKMELNSLPAASGFETYRLLHNHAVFLHYGLPQGTTPAMIDAAYKQAVQLAPSSIYRAFTIRNHAIFLSENQQAELATDLLHLALKQVSSQRVEQALLHNLNHIMADKAEAERDVALAQQAKENILKQLTWFQANNKPVQVALLLQDACRLANVEGSFAEALNYVNRAIDIFAEQGLEELLGNARLLKGRLLLAWANQENPAMYTEAAQVLVQSGKSFSSDHHPAIYADVQHLLAVAWASASLQQVPTGQQTVAKAKAAFEETLRYYTQAKDPERYGNIHKDYGMAYASWPAPEGGSHLQVAIGHFRNALAVLPAATHATKRADTLIAVLEACQDMALYQTAQMATQLDELVLMAQEVETLTDNPEHVRQARMHLSSLLKLAKAAHRQNTDNA